MPSDYIRINSGLGESPPLNIIVLPILFEGSVRAVIELASFAAFSATHQSLLDQLTESIGLVLNTVEATSVTEQLLEQAQTQAQELQSRQEQLHQSNEDLAEQAALLAEKNSEVEGKYQEVEEAKRLVEEKATELSVSSKYKSEFIANMSHELRTPLNSLLVLAEQLEDNPEGNLTTRQVQYASVIRASGGDLLKLLNDILDLAKVESNTVTLEIGELALADLCESMDQVFRPVANGQGLAFTVESDDALPASIVTDPYRLRQVLKNLLSNAFKFTDSGAVALRLELSHGGWSPDHEGLSDASSVIAISIRDTGIGIKKELHNTMFEAFAQADGSTARQHGGTGLGLSISRDLVRLLGGEITLASEPGHGSTFTVYLPLVHRDTHAAVVPLTVSPSAPRTVVDQGTAVAVASRAELSVAGEVQTPVVELDGTERASRDDGFYQRSAAGTTVLIVDDDFRNIFALTALLERARVHVIAADGGTAALAILDQRCDIDMVLMDIMMPVMNGYEAMAAIRRRPEWRELPIIAVTGKVVGGERERCIAAGASDYIPKPVDTTELMAALGEWFPAIVHPPAVQPGVIG